ncbi:LamG-like jellyroll fold domain-containing protein [Flavivirga aquimarina]|uniref:LamG-like jellyroll fold domain-containing protein n=1 Tax=Flavivirga aquimarina TaxID=2027862 RepID=A0ABT8WFD5_9FLAO|nr:LamG-like jellyroll fold domain-containing protein [Flavivirga aquimarina]MDO5971711.1 LamG-like jellyroll fold domain-containing protein [Flavivirga aquimarina]
MKDIARRYSLMILVFSLHISFNAISQTIASYDFESGLQGWTDGGLDSGLNTSAIYASNGSRSIYSKDNDTSQNYTTSPTLNLSAYSSIDFSFSFIGRGIDTGEGFSLQYFNGSSWSTIKTYVLGTDFDSNNYIYTFYQTISSGLVSNAQFRFSSTANANGEYSYFDDVLIKVSEPEIDITGNSLSISNGDVTPTNSDHTSYGTSNAGTVVTRTYTIYNKGGSNLTISNIALSNTTDFSIIAPFYSSPVLPSTGTTTFTIQFNPPTLGTKTCTVTITNNDSDEASYQFDIDARSEQNFFDSDGDGILDNIDIDDDNDGILDSEEELSCSGSSISRTTNYKFLNETFGEGNRTTINTTYDATTTYCYEDGTNGSSTTACPSLGNDDLSDGEYVVYYKAGDGDGIDDTPNAEVASWADNYWYTGEDHTSGDTNGRMAMFNASYDPGIFYTATIIGSLPNIPITYSFWVLNLDTTTAPGIATRLRPDILVEFRDVNNNLLTSITTGDIPPSINGDPAGSWHQFTANLTFNVSEFYVYFINNEIGGAGNDLAIDDIVISQTLCDTDGDGVADIFDLDSDNDGIPDVVEAGLGNYSDGNATLTNSGSWVDSNNNGMHDLSEGNSTLDSDLDGIPNYLDLDSDNDSIFDVDESGASNSGSATYQNGDGDVTGDGVGDGTDTDAVRETDINSDGTLEYFPDGILDAYDFFNGITFATAYGNSNQGSTGSGWEYYVADTDNDNTPDYIDLTSDGSTYDISHTLYASLDGNNDGLIDDTNDAEGDGIVDLFDTDDTVFGSPRDLDQKLQLYFDGRNDYAAESSVIDGWGEASIMAWIKIDPTATGAQVIVGQDEFYIRLNTDKSITAFADGNAITNDVALNTNQWVHVAATYSDSNSIFNLYINGSLSKSVSITGALDSDSSSFTIGRQPDTDNSYFHGYIDEVRVFDKALTENELKKMVHQEIENNAGIARGTIIPLDITDFVDTSNITPLNWSSLQRYYRLDTYKDNVIDDLTTASIDVGSGARIYNTKIIDEQTAPLPYVTTMSCTGNWSDPNNWAQGNLWDISSTTPDCAIVQIKGDLQISTDLSTIGLILDSGSELEVNGDSGLYNDWYLKLDGDIDLEGDSQLVQTYDSMLDATSSGTLEKDQQGTADTYTYNYWSSPVGLSNNSTNNNSYKLPNIFTNVTFLTSGYDGTASPVGIADYWIWKFSNQLGEYSKWQHVRSTGSLLVGEGFTMKGPGTGSISIPQNYVLKGKPNNGDINLTISTGNEYLIGNPYPSAIDAVQFILDNGDTINGTGSTTGTLYFWEHWGGGSHILNEYQGGYATYSLSGGVPAASKGTNHPDVATGGTPTKTPARYIPVAQGFFVAAEAGGTIKFNNGQRVFQTEDGSNSLFVKSSNTKKSKTNSSNESNTGDTRMKLRIGFNSVNEIHRQLLVTVDENASANYDWGYDSKNIDTQVDDMYWLINNEKFTIQGINVINEQTVIPIGIHTNKDGFNSITIDALENTPDNLELYVHDKELDIYKNLKQGNYDTYLTAGEYLNRFEITFSKAQKTLDVNDINDSPIEVYFSNEKNSIIINNPVSKLIKSVEMFNILGQSLFKFQTNSNEKHLEYNASQIKTGNYILRIKTEYGVISKKILIK